MDGSWRWKSREGGGSGGLAGLEVVVEAEKAEMDGASDRQEEEKRRRGFFCRLIGTAPRETRYWLGCWLLLGKLKFQPVVG